jgi:diacylglycerol kinase family enzyme/membrane-associated phospholipid phosphatase
MPRGFPTLGRTGRPDGGRPTDVRPMDLRARFRGLVPGPVRRADLAVFRLVAQRELPVIGAALPVLSRAANRSTLWVTLAAGLATIAGRKGRRAALRGVLSIAATSLLTNLPAKHLVARVRPELAIIPEVRQLARVPASTSFPSGHAASAMAFATAVSLEMPRLRLPLGAVAAAVGFSRVYTGVHYPADVLVGAAMGTVVARGSTRLWPVPDPMPAQAATAEPVVATDGAGVIVVANVDAGSVLSSRRTERLRALLPEVEILEADPSEDLEAALERAAATARVLGVAGGDGSASAAARIAAGSGTPLLLVSAGTLNHLATDLGVEDVAQTAQAVRQGRTIRIDLGELNGRTFVNAASLGVYPMLVDERERWERYVGKWPAFAWAILRVLATGEPMEVDVDGRTRRVWSLFLGNGPFVGDGLVPTRRLRLDDGELDVRVIHAERPWSRLRILGAAMVGRVGRSPVYERWSTDHLEIKARQEPLRIACDGEVLSSTSDIAVRIRRRALAVLQPTTAEG